MSARDDLSAWNQSCWQWITFRETGVWPLLGKNWAFHSWRRMGNGQEQSTVQNHTVSAWGSLSASLWPRSFVSIRIQMLHSSVSTIKATSKCISVTLTMVASCFEDRWKMHQHPAYFSFSNCSQFSETMYSICCQQQYTLAQLRLNLEHSARVTEIKDVVGFHYLLEEWSK